MFIPSGLVALTLLIGIIVSNYNESRGTALLTVEQKRWKDLKVKLKLTTPLREPPRLSRNFMRQTVYDAMFSQV